MALGSKGSGETVQMIRLVRVFPACICFCLIFYVPVNNFSVMSGRVFLG